MRHHLPPRHVPAAAGSASAPLVRGAARTGRVVTTTRLAAFIEMDDPPPERGDVADQPAVLALIDPEAVRLPCSLVLSEPLPPLHNGAVAVLGADRVCVGGMRISPSRWWRVPRPALSRPGDAVTRAATITSLPDADVLPTEVATASTRLMSALNSPDDDLIAAVGGLLGLGPGLTPAGDDVLAGALVALSGTAPDRRARLADAVAANEPARRTTVVSAALLRHAATGECIPELADLMAALDGREDLPSAHRRLLEVGHTSGPALALGAVHALSTQFANMQFATAHRRIAL